jgi:hypothetical protein
VGVATRMMGVWGWVMEVVEKLQLLLEIRQEFQERRVWIRAPIWYFVRQCAALATSSIARRLIRVDLRVQDAGITRRWLMVALGSASVDRCPRLISETRSLVFPVPFSSSRAPLAPLTAAPSATSPLLRPSPICAERWYGYPLNRHRRSQQRTAEHIFALFLAVPSVLAIAQALRVRCLLDRLPGEPISRLIV